MRKKIYVPESVGELKVWQYIDLIGLENKSIEDVISYICQEKTENVLKLSPTVVKSLEKKINKLFNNLETAVKKGKQDFELIKEFSIDGVVYKIEPDIEALPYGQVLDMERFGKDVSTICEFIYCFYRPVEKEKKLFFWTKKSPILYKLQSYFKDDITLDKESRKEHLHRLRLTPINVYLGLHFFFITLCEQLLKGLNTFTAKGTKGSDMQNLMAMGIYHDLTKSLQSNGGDLLELCKYQRLLIVNQLRRCISII